MAVRLSALHTGRALLPINIIFLLLGLFSVRLPVVELNYSTLTWTQPAPFAYIPVYRLWKHRLKPRKSCSVNRVLYKEHTNEGEVTFGVLYTLSNWRLRSTGAATEVVCCGTRCCVSVGNQCNREIASRHGKWIQFLVHSNCLKCSARNVLCCSSDNTVTVCI
jgi:hypothetical protein